MVRLKEIIETAKEYLKKFQFLDGAIKSSAHPRVFTCSTRISIP